MTGTVQQKRLQRAEQEINGPARGGIGWVASGLAGAAGRAWSYVTDEAAMLDATAPGPLQPRMGLALDMQFRLAGRATLFGILVYLLEALSQQNSPTYELRTWAADCMSSCTLQAQAAPKSWLAIGAIVLLESQEEKCGSFTLIPQQLWRGQMAVLTAMPKRQLRMHLPRSRPLRDPSFTISSR